ncbi:opine metallophore biosynthesis dehydrogenase [Paenibacillus taiwanensis]|uniref:opine metallophore biosynthesis dehydrogenase n=1 Tax=Paenibacillus taiwanensis TaxID=401638 RepID=UPI000410C533|nr:opine metallophore biosynthesis dehydrogenase [Paenibacillus taiwanensis]
MHDFQRILIAGTGPASIQMAVILKHHLNGCIGIAGRQSARSESFFTALKQSDQQVHVDIQNEKHHKFQGKCRLDHVFDGYDTVAGHWDTLILAVTADAYLEVLQQLNDEVRRQIKCVVLLSPTFGSGALTRQCMNVQRPDIEIISFSTYLGDTRWVHAIPSNRVITTGVKKKVFIGSTHTSSQNMEQLRALYEQLDIAITAMNSTLEAETRNISLYVHPPLFMNDFSLSVIFGEASTTKCVYKLFPEGPITQALIRNMRSGWKEISAIVEKLNMSGVNLLKFMTDDNYPVRTESLSRHDIDHFVHLETIHQEYLLYVRYASLLIDPFSEPDSNGKYFDFSAVPIRQIFINQEGKWDIPRMPKEDYYRIKIIQGIAKHLHLNCPMIDQFISTYEHKIEQVALKLKGELLSDAFIIQSFAKDIEQICEEIENSAS